MVLNFFPMREGKIKDIHRLELNTSTRYPLDSPSVAV